MTKSKEIGVVFLQPGCNMQCAFCITDNRFSTMTMSQAVSMLDHLWTRGIHNVVLGGGEPFAWEPGVLKLAAEAKARGFYVQIGTNGVALPKGFSVHPTVDRYVLPLESVDPFFHNTMRLHAGGHHQIILDRLEKLRADGKPVTVSTVVSSPSAAELPRLADFLSDYVVQGGRLHAWHLYRFIPSGRGGSRHERDLFIEEDAYDDACAAVKAQQPIFTLFKRKDMRHSKTVDFFWYEGNTICAGSESVGWGSTPSRALAQDFLTE
jgi:MoaA/NifB/PqqE/SkfB family radical SAM enzyme